MTSSTPNLNIVIPMAGLGSRFQQAGYKTPKPLIDVLGRPMYACATDSLPLEFSTKLIFVLLGSQPEFNSLRADILTRYAKYKPIICTVPEVTSGQAVTVLAAKDFIDFEEPLLIHNADTAFTINPDWVLQAWHHKNDGALLVFESQDTRWSYSLPDSNGAVIQVKEKEVISSWASTGTYWFRSGREFVRLAEARINSSLKEASEYYVGPLYNDIIENKGLVKNYVISELFCFGTPSDYDATLKKIRAQSND